MAIFKAGAAAAAALIVLVVLFRALTFKSKRYPAERAALDGIDFTGAAGRLAGAIKFKTISDPEHPAFSSGEFLRLAAYLETSYPLVHANLEKESVGEYSVLYRWKGSNEEAQPVLFSAHLDVVAVEEGTERDWLHPPFGGDLADGYVWGRGAMDMKFQVIALLEAAEHLLREGYRPARDIYLAFGHDEEIGGGEGARRIAELLRSRGVKPAYVLDEGGSVTEGVVAGVSSPVAVVGIGEKGFASIRLTAESEGGHSSMPPRHTAAGMIGRAVAALEKHPRPARLSGHVRLMLSFIGPEMSFAFRLILANLWLFAPLFKAVFTSFPAGNAILRTTTAVTMLEGGTAPNVLPQKASAVVNFRIAPGETGAVLLAHVKKVIRNDKIKIEMMQLSEPSRISPVDSAAFKLIENVIYSVFPAAVVAPYVVIAATDAVKYEPVCGNIYRFSPFQIAAADLERIHGTNERISFENIGRSIAFFIKLFKSSFRCQAPNELFLTRRATVNAGLPRIKNR